MSVADSTSLFKAAVNAAMLRLAAEPNAVFVGQSVRYDGAAIHGSLAGVPMEQRLEMPVIEDFQLGFCTGLALMGKLPICIYPRFDFLLLAANQLVNHLDKLPMFGWFPKVIIRTTVGQKQPLDAGPQHTQDHTNAFRLMLHNVHVHQARTAQEVDDCYARAMRWSGSTLIVENPCG
jgi:pyruvate/2-oxoglutarate/acetoin dehydrogenase E1 component